MSYFTELQTRSVIYDQLVQLANSPSGWYDNFGFDMLNVPDDLIEQDPVLAKIVKQFPHKEYASRAILLKLKPFIFYKLHKDTVRTCAINLLLKGDGITFSGEDVEGSTYLHTVHQLVYKPEHYYLLDTKCSHAVLNLDSERIIFSMSFTPPYSYNEVKYFIQGENL